MVSKQFAFDLLASKLEKKETKVVIKKVKQKKEHPWEVVAGTAYLFRRNRGYYFEKIVPGEMLEEKMQMLLKKNKLLHTRPVADSVLAKVVYKSKLKKYKIGPYYDIPQDIVDLLCTFTK